MSFAVALGLSACTCVMQCSISSFFSALLIPLLVSDGGAVCDGGMVWLWLCLVSGGASAEGGVCWAMATVVAASAVKANTGDGRFTSAPCGCPHRRREYLHGRAWFPDHSQHSWNSVYCEHTLSPCSGHRAITKHAAWRRRSCPRLRFLPFACRSSTFPPASRALFPFPPIQVTERVTWCCQTGSSLAPFISMMRRDREESVQLSSPT